MRLWTRKGAKIAPSTNESAGGVHGICPADRPAKLLRHSFRVPAGAPRGTPSNGKEITNDCHTSLEPCDSPAACTRICSALDVRSVTQNLMRVQVSNGGPRLLVCRRPSVCKVGAAKACATRPSESLLSAVHFFSDAHTSRRLLRVLAGRGNGRGGDAVRSETDRTTCLFDMSFLGTSLMNPSCAALSRTWFSVLIEASAVQQEEEKPPRRGTHSVHLRNAMSKSKRRGLDNVTLLVPLHHGCLVCNRH